MFCSFFSLSLSSSEDKEQKNPSEQKKLCQTDWIFFFFCGSQRKKDTTQIRQSKCDWMLRDRQLASSSKSHTCTIYIRFAYNCIFKHSYVDTHINTTYNTSAGAFNSHSSVTSSWTGSTCSTRNYCTTLPASRLVTAHWVCGVTEQSAMKQLRKSLSGWPPLQNSLAEEYKPRLTRSVHKDITKITSGMWKSALVSFAGGTELQKTRGVIVVQPYHTRLHGTMVG